MDRFDEIKRRWMPSPTTKADQSYEQACSDINWLVAEIKRLRSQHDGTTHADGCWSWGSRHYECAVGEIERLRKIEEAALEWKKIYSICPGSRDFAGSARATLWAELHNNPRPESAS